MIASAPSDYLAHEHTVKHFRQEPYTPTLVPADSYESWLASGGRSVVSYASDRVSEILRDAEPPSMAEGIRKELDRYVALRRKTYER